MKASKETFLRTLQGYRESVEKALFKEMERFDDGSRLQEACKHAVLGAGKRFRPVLVLMVADGLGGREKALNAAVAVELFHTASLVADDLPCMDDDSVRRDKPTVHKAFDEATALLVTYALIAQGYECLTRGDQPEAALEAIRNTSYNSGFFGAAGGQHLDLSPPDQSEETQKEIIRKKTVTLFEMSFVLGWLFAGGKKEQLLLVKQAAHHFGMAFQIADDLEDFEEDAKHGRKVNLAIALGVKDAEKEVVNELNTCEQVLADLKIDTPELQSVLEALRERVSKKSVITKT